MGAAIAEAQAHLLNKRGGGTVRIDGQGDKIFLERPIDSAGVKIKGVGLTSPAGNGRTRLQPLFRDDSVLRLHETPEGNGVQHWRSGSFVDITVTNPLKLPGLVTLQILGGNWAPVRRVTQQHSVDTHILCDEGHKSSGQYSVIEDFFGWAATHGLRKTRGPDIKWVRPVLYGNAQTSHDARPVADGGFGPAPEAGSVGVDLAGDSDIFVDPDVQFFATCWRLNSQHTVIRGGATELGQYWAPGSAKALIEIGPDATWIFFGPAHSFAHVDKVASAGAGPLRRIVDLSQAAPNLHFDLYKPMGIASWQIPPADRWCITDQAKRP